MAIATCHTEGCSNADIPIDVGPLSWTDVDGETHTTTTGFCGVCGQEITDIEGE